MLNLLSLRSVLYAAKSEGNELGYKIDRHNLRRAFNIAIEKAGVQNFHFHDLRHTFATRLAQRGIDIYKIGLCT